MKNKTLVCRTTQNQYDARQKFSMQSMLLFLIILIALRSAPMPGDANYGVAENSWQDVSAP